MAASTSSKGRTVVSDARCDAMSEVLADNWWAVGLRGILGIIFGLICLLTPGIAVQVFVILFAAYMFVDGVFAIISGIKAARNGERWGLLDPRGRGRPRGRRRRRAVAGITLVALIWIIAVWATVSGILMLIGGLQPQSRSRTLVARARRHRLDHLRHPPRHRAVDRRRGADHVDRRLRARVRRVPAGPRLPAPFAQRGTRARGGARCGEEGLNRQSANSRNVSPANWRGNRSRLHRAYARHGPRTCCRVALPW